MPYVLANEPLNPFANAAITHDAPTIATVAKIEPAVQNRRGPMSVGRAAQIVATTATTTTTTSAVWSAVTSHAVRTTFPAATPSATPAPESTSVANTRTNASTRRRRKGRGGASAATSIPCSSAAIPEDVLIKATASASTIENTPCALDDRCALDRRSVRNVLAPAGATWLIVVVTASSLTAFPASAIVATTANSNGNTARNQ